MEDSQEATSQPVEVEGQGTTPMLEPQGGGGGEEDDAFDAEANLTQPKPRSSTTGRRRVSELLQPRAAELLEGLDRRPSSQQLRERNILMVTSSLLEESILKGTDESLVVADYDTNRKICDLINFYPEGPKDAANHIRERLENSHPRVRMLALNLLDFCVQHCDHSFQDLIAEDAFMSVLKEMIKQDGDSDKREVGSKVLTMMKYWSMAFEWMSTAFPDFKEVYQKWNEQGHMVDASAGGDYLGIKTHPAIKKLLSKNGESTVLFSDIVKKVNRRNNSQSRVLLISDKAIYNLTPQRYSCKRRISLKDISSLSHSNTMINFLVIHVPTEYDYLLETPKRSNITNVIKQVSITAGKEVQVNGEDV